MVDHPLHRRIHLSRLSHQVGPPLVAALAARAGYPNSDHILNLFLTDYSGPDAGVMRICANSIIRQALHDASKWKMALPLLRRAYKMDVTVEESHWGQDPRKQIIGNAIANEILRFAQEYPLWLVNAAQDYMTKSAGSKAKAPGDVALAEHWFSIDDFA
jgi:hypothetical protein